MIDLVGLTAILLVCIVTYLISIRWQEIATILFTAIIIRLILIFIDHFLIPLPDTTADAVSFEYMAWTIAQNGFTNLLDYYPGFRYDFYNWLIAIPYSLFGRSILMAKSIGLLFGIGSIVLTWKIASILWDDHVAKSSWTITLFPSLILYSVIMMRSLYLFFCFSCYLWSGYGLKLIVMYIF